VGRARSQRTLLAVPKRIRGAKGDGDVVEVELLLDAAADDLAPPPRAARPRGSARRRPV
jgi:hypothetical protein